MQKIQSLALPDQLPTPGALRSCNQTKNNYDPEIWEFQYEAYRYLKNVSDHELDERYRELHRNFCILVRPERNIIPIDSFLSSWYWYRKEHQTRYECFLRKHPLPLKIPVPRGNFPAPIRPKGPNSCDILFRYGKLKFMKPFFEKGEVRISPASVYKDGPLSDPRTDDELNSYRHLPGQYSQVTTKKGKVIPIIGDIHETYSSPADYYALCMSCDFDPNMFEKFQYDSCLIIKEPKQFAARLEAATKDILKGWYCYHNPIEYFDPYEPHNNQYLDPAMCKDFSFAYQMEYRIIWFNNNNQGTAEDHVFLSIGPLKDICSLYLL